MNIWHAGEGEGTVTRMQTANTATQEGTVTRMQTAHTATQGSH